MTIHAVVLFTLNINLKFQLNFKAITTNDSGKALRVDNGSDYISNESKDYLSIRHELTVPYTPEQNWVAKLLNCMEDMMSHSNAYWAEAVATYEIVQ